MLFMPILASYRESWQCRQTTLRNHQFCSLQTYACYRDTIGCTNNSRTFYVQVINPVIEIKIWYKTSFVTRNNKNTLRNQIYQQVLFKAYLRITVQTKEKI